jgi:predicted Zn-dependent peptidase
MTRLASHALNDDTYRTIDGVLELIDGVTVDTVAGLATEFLAPERMTTVRLGPVE